MSIRSPFCPSIGLSDCLFIRMSARSSVPVLLDQQIRAPSIQRDHRFRDERSASRTKRREERTKREIFFPSSRRLNAAAAAAAAAAASAAAALFPAGPIELPILYLLTDARIPS